MIKQIPLEDTTLKSVNVEQVDRDNAILNDDLFPTIYDENPKHWHDGLNKELFNDTDLIYLLKTTDDNIIGFFIVQTYRESILPKEFDYGNYIVIGILSEFRGKGIAKKIILAILEDINLDNLIYIVNDTNKASIALCKSLNKSLDKDNQIRLVLDSELDKPKQENLKQKLTENNHMNKEATIRKIYNMYKLAFTPAPKQAAAGPMPPQGGGAPMPPQGGGQVDPNTGMPIDPNTGMPIDPNTGMPIDPNTGMPMQDPAAGGGDPSAQGGGQLPPEIMSMLDQFAQASQQQEQSIQELGQTVSGLNEAVQATKQDYASIKGTLDTVLSIMQGKDITPNLSGGM